jgi:hypothetical protein
VIVFTTDITSSNVRGSSSKHLGATGIRHQPDARRKQGREGSDHGKLGAVVADEVEARDGADEQHGCHKRADNRDGDVDRLLGEAPDVVQAGAGELFFLFVRVSLRSGVIRFGWGLFVYLP